MEVQHIAVIGAVALCARGYFISFFSFSSWFTSTLQPPGWRKRINSNTSLLLMVGLPVALPFLAGMAFRVGGLLQKRGGIAWGCYFESFSLTSMVLWGVSAMFLSTLVVVSLVKPGIFGFKNRVSGLLFYLVHHFYTLLLLALIIKLLPILSGPLSGKTATCL